MLISSLLLLNHPRRALTWKEIRPSLQGTRTKRLGHLYRRQEQKEARAPLQVQEYKGPRPHLWATGMEEAKPLMQRRGLENPMPSLH